MSKKTVLIVDDDRIIREQLARELKRNFFQTFLAADGKTALETFSKEEIEILLLDIKLPDMDGLEILETVKENKPDCEVIVITGFGTQEIAIQSLRRGAIDYIEKPIRMDELTTALGRAQEKLAEKEKLPYIIKTVLVIDDEVVIVKLLETFLESQGYQTFRAHSGEEGLNIIENNKIDVVIADIRLDGISGLDVLEKVKADKPDCEVIIITGFGTQEIAIQALRRGAIDYIEKPIRMDELTTALRRAQEKLSTKKELSYKHTLLVIDDEDEIVKRLKKFLEKEGYEVLGAHSGEEGLNIIENHKIDVIITDIKMNDMDGVQVLQRAKRLYQDIEGIVVTGYREQELAIRSLRAGAIDYIAKPINLDELLFSVSKAIERINLNRTFLYRNRELKITSEIISKMNEELERRIEERTEELTQTQVQLFQTSKLATLGEMAAGLAHEMNQPLGGIALTATFLRKLIDRGKLSEEEVELALDDIEASVKRMARIIQHIRTFARQDTLKFIQVDVNETIDSALSLLGEQLRLHEIEVVQDLSDDLPQIVGEPYQLEQVWINLIANARDAADEKGEQIADYQKSLQISTTCNSESGLVEVNFSDNGVGIPEETKEKIFEPFFTTKEVGKAMGLGLSISYGIIESHKGKIEFHSKEGEGTTAKVTLPLELDDG